MISEKVFQQAVTPYLGGYGYGWFIDQIEGERVIDHGGNIEGATSYFLMNPELDIRIILLNNITSTSLEIRKYDLQSFTGQTVFYSTTQTDDSVRRPCSSKLYRYF